MHGACGKSYRDEGNMEGISEFAHKSKLLADGVCEKKSEFTLNGSNVKPKHNESLEIKDTNKTTRTRKHSSKVLYVTHFCQH